MCESIPRFSQSVHIYRMKLTHVFASVACRRGGYHVITKTLSRRPVSIVNAKLFGGDLVAYIKVSNRFSEIAVIWSSHDFCI